MAQDVATDNVRFLDSASDHVVLVPSLSTAQHTQNHYDLRRADILSLKYQLSGINWHVLLSECPTIDNAHDLPGHLLFHMFSVCAFFKRP